MEGFLIVAVFLSLFVLGFPVVLAIGVPCIVYIFLNGLPIDLVAQRTLYALDSFPLVAVPVFLFVGSLMNSAGISAYFFKFLVQATGGFPGDWHRSISLVVRFLPAWSAPHLQISAAWVALKSTQCATKALHRSSPPQ